MLTEKHLWQTHDHVHRLWALDTYLLNSEGEMTIICICYKYICAYAWVRLINLPIPIVKDFLNMLLAIIQSIKPFFMLLSMNLTDNVSRYVLTTKNVCTQNQGA